MADDLADDTAWYAFKQRELLRLDDDELYSLALQVAIAFVLRIAERWSESQ